MTSVGVPVVPISVPTAPGAFVTQVTFKTKTPALHLDPFTENLAFVVGCGQLCGPDNSTVVPVPTWDEVCDHNMQGYHVKCYTPSPSETLHFNYHMELDTICCNLIVIVIQYFPDDQPDLVPVTACLDGL
jgi:hypothetical protein